MHWSLFLQPFNLDIQHVIGTENTMADAMSRAVLVPIPVYHVCFVPAVSLSTKFAFLLLNCFLGIKFADVMSLLVKGWDCLWIVEI